MVLRDKLVDKDAFENERTPLANRRFWKGLEQLGGDAYTKEIKSKIKKIRKYAGLNTLKSFLGSRFSETTKSYSEMYSILEEVGISDPKEFLKNMAGIPLNYGRGNIEFFLEYQGKGSKDIEKVRVRDSYYAFRRS